MEEVREYPNVLGTEWSRREGNSRAMPLTHLFIVIIIVIILLITSLT